jgi:DNA primase
MGRSMDIVSEIKARLDIVEVVGQYVPLRRAGRLYRALCPFHTERTPSFYVSPERQSWHCFGACNTGGDVFSFIMRKEGVGFGEALRMLAQRAGVELPSPRSPQEEARRQRLYQAHEAAMEFYHRLLMEDATAAHARRYLEGRGIDMATARRFMLGYSPPSGDALLRHLTGKGFRLEEVLEAGLLVTSEGLTRDRFRGRLMFPIWDEQGRPVGFGARALDDSHPKYLNTPQTPIFDKGGLLYLLDRARHDIRRSGCAVIVEGYMDAIAAHQAGFANVVASMGTALTERHVRSLRRHCRRIVLALDADAAGAEAVLRGHQVVEASEGETMPELTWRGLVRFQTTAGVDLRVAILPPGRDPDEVIRESPQLWQALVAEAEPVLDYRFRRAQEGKDLRDPQARSQLVQELLPIIAAVGDPVVRAHYLQKLARLSLVREEELASMMRRRRQEPSPAPRREGEHGPDPERLLLSLLLRYPDLRPEAQDLPEGLFWGQANIEVFRAWKECQTLVELAQKLPEELWAYTDGLISLWTRFPQKWDNDNGRRAFGDVRRRLEERYLRARKRALAAALATHQEESAPDQQHLLEEAFSAVREGRAGNALAQLLREDLELGFQLHSRAAQREANSHAEA